MDLESTHFDFVFPNLIMELNVIKNSVDKSFDIRILITQQLEHYLHHLRLMQHYFASSFEEQELEEGVENLLNHFIVLLLGA